MTDTTNNQIPDLSTPEALAGYAKKLEGMTFSEVLDLNINAGTKKLDVENYANKGNLGGLLEERYFGYERNSKSAADFEDAGVELKTTCYDVRKNGDWAAGERLVLGMIPHDAPIESDLYSSHIWDKSKQMLIVYYERNKTLHKLEQVIRFARLFTPSEVDLKIIEHDYEVIKTYIQEGRAHELSEGLTTYLGACTKGATEASSWKPQYYNPEVPAKRRAFCFKQPYMNYVLHHYFMNDVQPSEAIIDNPAVLDHQTFEEYIVGKIDQYIGKTDKELCELVDLKYTNNKAQWNTIVYRLLGLHGEHAEEFEKANISVKTVRVKKKGKLAENLSLPPFRFVELLEEQDWNDALLRAMFDETKFFFVVFQEVETGYVLRGARFWSMSVEDIDGPLQECWDKTREVLTMGVELIPKTDKNGKVTYANNLPKQSENRVAHVRPHAAKSAYRFEDGTEVGDVDKDGDELPDGRAMTKQSFWLNGDYIFEVIKIDDEQN